MKPNQLDLMTAVSTPTLDPTGRVAVVATSRANFATDSYTGQLWQVATDGQSDPRRITAGKSDRAPQFSPDGTVIAFLRPDEKGRSQIALIDALGGEPRIITSRHMGVNSFAWSADSTKIAFTSAVPGYGRYGTVAGINPGQEDPRRITENQVRANGAGWTLDRKSAIFVIDVPTAGSEPYFAPIGRAKDLEANGANQPSYATGQDGQPKTSNKHAAVDQDRALRAATTPPGAIDPGQEFPEARLLTDPQFAAGSPVWGPNDAHVYFVSAQHEGADNDLCSSIYRVATSDGAAFEPLHESEAQAPAAELVLQGESRNLSLHTPAFSEDFATLYVLGQDVGDSGQDFVAKNTGVWAVSAADLPSGNPQLLTNIGDVDYGDVHSTLVTSGGGVLAFARLRGAGQLHRVELGAEQPVATIVAGPRVVSGAATAGGTIVVSYTDPTTHGEIATVADGALSDLTDFAAPLHEHTHVAEQIEFEATSRDGYPVHGWILKPATEGPHPVLLNIHGGPFADYHWAYFDEAQTYVEAGYAVVMCNPRGSAGYGQDHGRAIRQQMGTLDMDDVMSFFEQAVASDDSLDGDRAGVMGGSYGGYLTAWIIGHDHRFKGAIVERGFLEPFSFVGTSDIGWFFADEYTGTDPAQILAQSPMACADQVRTPTLVLHSEEDIRCPLEQAQRYYAALKRAGVESEFLVFPGENHELSRSGTPWHRMQRFDAILEWWQRHLPVNA